MLTHHPRFPVRQMLTIGLLPAVLKAAYYRSRGARVGPNVRLGFGSVIIADELEIGEGVQIGFGTFLRARRVSIGRHARIGSTTFIDAETIAIGEDAKISEQVFVGGLSSPESHFRLGARTILMQHTFINVARPVTIGDDTGIGGKCTIFTHGSWQNMLQGYPVTYAPVTIGRNVWIPWQVFIMPGVTIGDGATIGASSLVTRDIPAGALAVGSPVKVIRGASEYPTRPDAEQQAGMLRQMMTEFCAHLEHAHLSVQRAELPAAEQISVATPHGPARLRVYYVQTREPLAAGQAEVVLALTGLPPEPRPAEPLWLDLARLERSGPGNPLGEELVEFIKRYGVRFARVPAP